ncbi:MAG: carboxylating nicotinate-nucleotide diphosphorylase [Candidatus Aminicenantes bacterium]|nr:carboxylating nicotinate-nucleotide diphosphorylase [Candidatus Aminicenantes bacterium]
MLSAEIEALIDSALREDVPAGDVTSESLIPSSSMSRAVLLAKESGRLAGIEVAARVFRKAGAPVSFVIRIPDGRDFRKGDVLADVRGRSRVLLKAERTALNFLQRLSGIATLTQAYVAAVRGTGAKILDTRKTTPGWRALEKYAVRMGGGENHRLSLSDMALIKDNHLQVAGGVAEAVRRVRRRIGPKMRIEVEATNFASAREAVEAGADMILLDNMPPAALRRVASWVDGRVPLEASGGVTLRRVRRIAASGMDYISVGALTHSAPAIDISLEFES